MIHFEEMSVQNFNSIGTVEHFDFTEGIHAVKGLNLDEEKAKSNGTGKSSFLSDAPTWILYGVTPGGKRGDKVINRVFGKNCFGKLSFRIGEMSYRIERYRKHDDFGDDIRVFINDQDATIHPPSKNQQTINDIIQIPFELFTSSFVIAQGLQSRFTSLTDFQRKEIIENIRKNYVWDESREIARKKLKDLESQIQSATIEIGKKQELSESYYSQLQEAKKQVRTLQQSKATLEGSADLREWQQRKQQTEQELEDLSRMLDEQEEVQKEQTEQLNQLNEQLSTTLPDQIGELKDRTGTLVEVLEVSTLQQEVAAAEKKVQQVSEDVNLVEKREKLDKATGRVKEQESKHKTATENYQKIYAEWNKQRTAVTELTFSIQDVERRIKFYTHTLDPDHDTETCPECGSVPGAGSTETIKKNLKERKKELSRLNKDLKEERKKQDRMATEVTKYKEQMNQSSATPDLEPLREAVREAEKQVNEAAFAKRISEDRLKEARQRMQELGFSEDDLPRLDKKLDTLKDRVKMLIDQRESVREQIGVLQQEQTDVTGTIQTLKERKQTCTSTLGEVSEQIAAYQRELDSIQTQIGVKMTDIETYTQKRGEVIEQKKSYQEKEKELQEQLPIYKSLDKIFSPKGIRAHLIAKDIGFINQRLDYYSKHFFSDMYVQLDPGIDDSGQVSKIDIPVTTTMDWEKTYDDCSGGEKRRIDICIQLAIFDLILSISSVTTNLLVMDEVFEGLDSEGVKAVMEVVHNLSQESPICCYVISHLPNLGEYVNDEVVFVKQGGVTEISHQLEHATA